MCFSQFSAHFNGNPLVYFIFQYINRGIIFVYLIICNILCVLCEQPVHTSLIGTVQFTLQPLLAILKERGFVISVYLFTFAGPNERQ